MINKSIFTQNLIFFGTPLAFSIVHAIAWLKIMQVAFNQDNILTSDTVTTSSIVIVSLMYSVYFLLTNMTCKRIIREKNR